MLTEILERIENYSGEERKQAEKEVLEATKDIIWIPSPGPQTEAYFSKADVLLYGGEPGGGKSSLLIGLALTQHRRSLILRRQYTDLGHIIEELQKFNGGKQGWNGSPPPQLKRPDGKVIDLGAAAKVGDEQHWQGNPHDFIGVDEATQFVESQIRFLMGWVRCAEDPKQRKRVILATNPPLDAEGLWVTEMFAPWLDDKYLRPAKHGELRWAIMGEDDKNIWVDGPGLVEYNGRMVEPKSYTYIPASLTDNPFLAESGYQKELDNLPESIRSILMGGFKFALKDAERQVIPTEWVRLAQQRWRPNQPDAPMCAIGVDATGGGTDPLVLAPRHDGWYAPLISVPAKQVPKDALGKTTVGHIIANRRDKAMVIIDIGGGYGSSAYELLKDNEIDVQGYLGAETTSRRSTKGNYKFVNTRSAAYWLFGEALDPDQPGGSPIALPPDRKILADLTAPTYKITPNGIKIEPKEDVCTRLGRSTNDGDAIVMAWFTGPRMKTNALEWADYKQSRGVPKVVMGRHHARRQK